MTAPSPRGKKLGIIPFVRNAYGNPDLFGPSGGLSLEDYEEGEIDVTGTLTISGGTVSGIPALLNPESLLKALEISISGSPLSDNYVELPVSDLISFNIIEEWRKGADGGQPFRQGITSGDVGVYTFRLIVRVPFCADDMPNPYKYFLPMNRYGVVKIRIKWGTEEDLVQGGDRTKAISACQATLFGKTYTGNADFDLRTDMMFHQRINSVSRPIVAAGTNQDLELVRTDAFLRGVLLVQEIVDANGVATPTDTIIRATDPVSLRLNDADMKWEEWTWEKFREDNRRAYGKYLPFGTIFLDNSPRGDEELLKGMHMGLFSKMTVRFNNANVSGGQLRTTLLKYSAAL